MKNITYPAALKAGDTIAIPAPAGKVKPANVENAKKVLENLGFKVKVMPHTLGEYGSFSGTPSERLSDFEQAWNDPEVKAIVCARGGYGVVHIMEALNSGLDYNNPKWVVGFSDISALHALMAKHNIASVHASMCSHIAKGIEDEDNASLIGILKGDRPAYTFPSSPLDRPGLAVGQLLGGNLAVLAELINTPYDIIKPDTILFVEDVAEPIYKIERMFYQLRLSGILPKLKGLIVGQFTEYKPDETHNSMEEMIAKVVEPYKYPVAFNVPIGHVEHNIPMIESATVTLKVSVSGKNSIIFHR